MKRLAPLVILLTLPLGLYWSAAHGEFHYDDIHHIVENQSIRSPAGIGELFSDPATFSSEPGVEMYRPALMATYTFNYYLGRLDPFGWHLFNILLHGVNSILVYAIALGLLKRKDAAFIAGILFAVHPVAGESVNYISSRSSLLLSTFFLSGFLAYMMTAGPGKKSAWPWLVLLNVLYVLGLLTKESAVALPFVIIIHMILFPRSGDEKGRAGRAWLALAPMIILTAGYIILRKTLLEAVLSPVETRPVWENLLTQSKAYFFYIRLLLWPAHLSVDHGFAVESSILGPKVVLAIAGLALLLALGIFLARSREPDTRSLSLCLAWYFLALLPTSSIVPLNMLVNERRVYLPLAAFAIAAGFAYIRIKPRAPKFLSGAFAFILVLFSGLVLSRNPTWNQEVTLWRDAYRKAPDNPRPARGLADYYFLSGRLEASLRFYREADQEEPDNEQTLHNIGLVLDMLGRPEEAVQKLKRAVTLDPKNPAIHFSLANAYDHAGARQLARFHLEESLALDPNYPMAHNNLGKILYEAGETEEAEKEYLAAITLEPTHELANFNLGILLSSQGRYAEALPRFRAAYKANPSYAENSFQLGLCFYRLHMWPDAREAFSKALEIDPGWKNAWYNLGLTERILGNPEKADAAFRRAGKGPP